MGNGYIKDSAMQVIFTKGSTRYAQLRCVRMDGSATQT